MSRKKLFDDNFYENSSIEFETLLNSLNEWENNPIESSRYCLKSLYNIIRYQQQKLEIIEKIKISKNEFNSGLNAKADASEFMSAINDISQNIEKRPTFDQIKLSLSDFFSKKEMNEILKKKTSLKEIKNNLENGNIKISIENIKEDLNRNFITFKNLSDILSTKPSKEIVLNLINQKANISDIEKINKELKNFNSINHRIQEIENNFKEDITNMNQQINKINNDNITKNKNDCNDIVKRLNEFDLKFNNYSDTINSTISDLDNKINLFINKYESMDKELKLFDNSIKELISKEKENKSIINIKNIENKINSICKDINKIFGILGDKINKYEIESINLELKELITKSKHCSNQKYITFQEFDNIYNSICNDIHQKFIDIDNYNKNSLEKINIEIRQNIDAKASNEEMNVIKNDLNKIKILLEEKSDLNTFNNMNNLEYIVNNCNHNYVNKKEFNEFLEIYQNDIGEIKNDILFKSNIQETMNNLKNKADISHVNNALNQIHDELEAKLSFKDFNQALNNINRINSALLRNNQVGEWISESGNVKNNHFILWEVQKINNCPENFIWNQNSEIIIVKQRGIYLFDLAIFMNDSDTIDLYINGEKILSKNNNDKVETQVNRDCKNNTINENPVGICIHEIILLQEKSRISVFYGGSDKVKGILAIKLLCNI